MSIKYKLLSIVLLMAVFLLFTGVMGMRGTDSMHQSLGTVYQDRVVPLKQLKVIADAYAVSVIDAVNKANAGLLSPAELRAELSGASGRIDTEWRAYISTKLTSDEQKLATEAEALFADANAAMATLSTYLAGVDGDLRGNLNAFDGELYRTIDPISNKIGELIELQLDVARAEFDASEAVYIKVRYLSLVLIGLGVLLGGAAVWILLRFVIRPLEKALNLANAVAVGKLDNDIARDGKDETGRLLSALGRVQDAVAGIIARQTEMASAHRQGMVSHMLRPDEFDGAYADIAAQVNTLAQTHIEVAANLVSVSREYARGNFSVEMARLPGEQAAISDAFAEVRQALLGISNNIKAMASSGADGDFSRRVDINGLEYLFRETADDLNRLLATCEQGFGDIRRVTLALSCGDLSQQIDAYYPGVFGETARSVNQTVLSLRQTLGEVETLVAGACNGDFATRMACDERSGYRLRLANSLNNLSQVTESGLKEISAVVGALSRGELDCRVAGEYPGLFGQTQQGVNNTADALAQFVADIDAMVNAAAREGDFSQTVPTDGRSGFLLTLASRLNELAMVTRDGLTQVKHIAGAIASGDLTQKVSGHYPGLFGETLSALDGTVERLCSMVAEIQDATATLQLSAREIASGNMDLSNRTEAQAHSVEETVANFRSLGDSINQNSRHAVDAAALARESAAHASHGALIVADVEQTMNGIEETSEQIASITGMIDSIAFQTNILALNAAVEAARAGDSGRGFGVVAAEVRSLASRSADAAREIRDVIGAAAVRISAGNQQAAKAGRAMQQIDGSVQSVAGLLEQIASATQTQGQGMVQVQKAVDQIDGVTQHNAALVEEASAAAASMQAQVERLAQLMSVFTLRTQDEAGKTRQNTRQNTARNTATNTAINKAVKKGLQGKAKSVKTTAMRRA
ncbi:MCP four helix bundle domain-containing protein [Shewanella sp. JM162201]|uniref:MCP four helix bundle domain-containing protein n=1 Tax=Shewanella jiangmenensis TaxID=2837387 RepID=A0ABS5V1T4_9GAMM|nr:methyl-accepting chemotaxis protein [Shewanella jiangmenensis]MBT1444419.1 MCP four helix bundle domain-containing protein [Shewanella jiangmenensis]